MNENDQDRQDASSPAHRGTRLQRGARRLSFLNYVAGVLLLVGLVAAALVHR